MTNPWVAAGSIRWRMIDGAAVILDLNSENYFILDSVASSMWEELLRSGNGDAVVRILQERHGVDRRRIESDVNAFLDQMLSRGFLEKEIRDSIPAHEPRRTLVARKGSLIWRAWWSLFRTWRSLGKRGFAYTYARYSALSTPADPDDADERLAESVAAFAKAENFFHMKRAPQDCLPRSLALFRFLRSVGLPVEHCIGVRRFPMHAHAWVEYRGGVVHDHPHQPRIYAELARVGV